jgi:hypothetical protein
MRKKPKPITELKPKSKESMDIRGMPTTICPCGSMVWNLKAIFEQDTGNIGMYFMDMECSECGTLATAPTPEDYNVSDV